MSPLVSTATLFVSLGIVAINIALAVFIFLAVFGNNTQVAKKTFKFISDYGIWFGIFFTVSAFFTSLFYSAVAGYAPCELCWWQRVFIFPQMIMFIGALFLRDKEGKADTSVFFYSCLLSICGAVIALYQLYGQHFNPDVLACSADAVSCAKIYFLSFGYISIPVMSLSGFLALLAISYSRYVSKA